MSNVGVNRFCHPGTLICPKEIAVFYQKQIPHPNALTKLHKSTPLDYKPSPIEHINLGAYGAGIGHKEITSDGAMCYQQTIAFLHTRNIVYAKNAINIINAWATTNKKFEGSNAPLEASWAVTSMIRSAEILKHNVLCANEWKTSNVQEIFNGWIDKVIYPLFCWKITWVNNWNLTMTEARMQLAIFRDNKSDFDWAVNAYRKIFDIYVKPWKTGQCGETRRDQVHAQFGIGSMINICEMAWHQGIDLYTPELHKCMEYHASILNGIVPSDIQANDIKENRFQPIGWEIGFQHFTKQKKLQMPQTQKLLEGKRPEWCIFCWGLSTMTHMK